MRPLPIIWQRLVDAGGRTCERCGSTEGALGHAVAKLKTALAPLGIEPTLETREIDQAGFQRDPSASNRIWIAGRPLEEWLGASTGSSQCCSVCGDADCRTVELGDTVYEALPEELIVQAALAAASQALAPAAASAGCGAQNSRDTQCCPSPKAQTTVRTC